MNENLEITIIQPDIVWENPKENLKKYSRLVNEIDKTDVIVLPEMCTTGFTMSPGKLKENVNGTAVNWMKKISSEKNAAIVGSIIFEEYDKVYNRALWVSPDGNITHYDKRHLFTMGQEAANYTAGISKTTVNFRGWKFRLQICYDLRFPVFARNTENYDVLINMANWPAARHDVWKNLLVARAIENQSYCIGVNRTGTDGAGINYKGDSVCISPKGVAQFVGDGEKIESFVISYSELHRFRKNFPVLNDRDSFEIID